MKKRIFSALITVCICLSFCGCAFIDNNDDLVSPPELTGEMEPIAQALYDVVGSDCDLKYPAEGDYRSAIVLEDINGDEVSEAFAFYSTSGDEMTTMHINVICQKDDKWESVADQTIAATGVVKVDFCDLNGDKKKEILVGWDVNGTNEKQLTTFSFNKNTLKQQMLQSYTNFLCCDLDNNGTNEVFVHHLNTVEKLNRAMLYSYDGKEIVQSAYCEMDSSVKSANAPILAAMTNGKKAIYIDETKGVEAVTEVLYQDGDELKNPMLDDVNSLENVSTKRAASITTQDIDGDGTLEIPVASELQNAQSGGESLYYTNWCTFNGEKLSVKMVTIVNTVDGYYLKVPDTMVGNVAVVKDIENHKREFYHYDSINGILGKLLFTVVAIDAKKWDSDDYDRGKKVELTRKGDTVFVVMLGDGAEAFAITTDFIKETFSLVS